MNEKLKAAGIGAVLGGVVAVLLSSSKNFEKGAIIGASIGAAAGFIVNPFGKEKQEQIIKNN
jgi:gas vesicle protein